MPVTSGFFNSLNGDRKYNAEEMGSLFGGIITDGIFANYPHTGEQLVVAPVSGLRIKVGPGRGWFHNTWINNDDITELNDNMFDCPTASSTYTRIDSIFIKVDTRNEGRKSCFVFESGEASDQPWSHVPVHNDENPTGVYWYRLADIVITPDLTTITSGDIHNYLGGEPHTGTTPVVPSVITAPLEHVSAAGVLLGWKEEVDAIVSAETQTALNQPSSAITTAFLGMLREYPMMWAISKPIPERAFSLVTYSSPAYSNNDASHYAEFSPDFYHYPENANYRIPKLYDTVIGSNGYFGVITEAMVDRETRQFSITIRSSGYSNNSGIENKIQDITKNIPVLWLCDHDIPSTFGQIVTYMKDESAHIAAQAEFYPDFVHDANVRSYSIPKPGDAVLGKNGQYGTITQATVNGSEYFALTIAGTGHGLSISGSSSDANILEITFMGIDAYDTTNERTLYPPDVDMYPSWPAIREAYNDGYKLVAKILLHSGEYQSGGVVGVEDEYVYAPVQTILRDGNLAGIETDVINYWGQTRNIDAIHYKWTTQDILVGWYDHLYISTNLTPIVNSIPGSCTVDAQTGLVTFKNGNGSALFTLQLPMYSGSVEIPVRNLT